VNDPTVWQYLQSVVRALFPGIIILRLADSDRPNMDKLFFYVRRLDKCLEKSKEILDTLQDKLYATGIGVKYGKMEKKKQLLLLMTALRIQIQMMGSWEVQHLWVPS